MENTNKTQTTQTSLDVLYASVNWQAVQTPELLDVHFAKDNLDSITSAMNSTGSIAGTWFLSMALTIVIVFVGTALHLSPRVTFAIVIVMQLLAYVLANLATRGFELAAKESAADYVSKLQMLGKKYPR